MSLLTTLIADNLVETLGITTIHVVVILENASLKRIVIGFLELRVGLEAVASAVARLAAVAARQGRVAGLSQLIVLGLGKLESRMHVFAVRAIGAKASEVVHAQHTPHVSVAALRAKTTKASVIPWAVFQLRVRADVQEGALLVVAGIKSGVEVALWHLSHVILVQKLALVTLLAETAQPMLANDGAVTPHMTEWA